MYFTKNDTTQHCGQAYATVIADSIYNGSRITTLELLYPRYIHSELMTHRAFSRNASSSRATPISVLISDARNPVFFDEVGINKPGMQSAEQIAPDQMEAFRNDWVALANYVADWVQAASDKYNIHKQVLNRVLEPFTNIRVLVTATDWDNFFKLRLDAAAQPEMRNLALAMKNAIAVSQPVERNRHTPYADDAAASVPDRAEVISVARCARVSYARLDGRDDCIDDDIRLFNVLEKAGHLSPFEHVAVAMNGRHANLSGWCSLRQERAKVNDGI